VILQVEEEGIKRIEEEAKKSMRERQLMEEARIQLENDKQQLYGG